MSRGAHLTRRYHPERLENRKSDDIYLQAMWWWFRSTRSEQTEIATIDVCHGIPARLCVWRVALGCRGTTCIETLTYYTSSWLWWVSKKKKGQTRTPELVALGNVVLFFCSYKRNKKRNSHWSRRQLDWWLILQTHPACTFLYTSETSFECESWSLLTIADFFSSFFFFLF